MHMAMLLLEIASCHWTQRTLDPEHDFRQQPADGTAQQDLKHTITLFRLETGTTDDLCGTRGGLDSAFALIATRLDDDPLSLTDEEGVEVPLVEFRVEDDLAVGTVPLDSLDESEVRKLALERLRSSLKKGIAVSCGFMGSTLWLWT